MTIVIDPPDDFRIVAEGMLSSLSIAWNDNIVDEAARYLHTSYRDGARDLWKRLKAAAIEEGYDEETEG